MTSYDLDSTSPESFQLVDILTTTNCCTSNSANNNTNKLTTTAIGNISRCLSPFIQICFGACLEK